MRVDTHENPTNLSKRTLQHIGVYLHWKIIIIQLQGNTSQKDRITITISHSLMY